MSDRMDPRLETRVDALGGKNGGLKFLGSTSALRDHIVPSIVLERHDRITANIARLLADRCADFKTNRVIVRLSHADDFYGLVDAMETKVGKIEDLDTIIAEVRAKCNDPRIVDYSNREGGHFDPDDVTVAIAPFIKGPRGLVTEHPNLPGVSCVDMVYDDYSDSSSDSHSFMASHSSVDFLNGAALPIYGGDSSVDARDGLELRNIVREAGLFSDDIALQYEFGLWNDRRFLYQVKFFANVNETDCSSSEIRKVFDLPNGRGYRNFGITPQDGLVLPCVNGESRSAFRRFEAKKPGVDYAFHLSLEGLTAPLQLEDLPRSMKAYFALKPPLTHQNARFVQSCLKRDGVAFLNSPYVLNCEGADNVKVLSDGLNSSVEAM